VGADIKDKLFNYYLSPPGFSSQYFIYHNYPVSIFWGKTILPNNAVKPIAKIGGFAALFGNRGYPTFNNITESITE
jgi:hypothetical protein